MYSYEVKLWLRECWMHSQGGDLFGYGEENNAAKIFICKKEMMKPREKLNIGNMFQQESEKQRQTIKICVALLTGVNKKKSEKYLNIKIKLIRYFIGYLICRFS